MAVVGGGAIVLAIGLLTFLIHGFRLGMENEFKAFQREKVSIARHAIEPILAEYRAGRAGREETLLRVRTELRRLVYEDQFGPNYIFMSGMDGTVLVRPFRPEDELKWDLNVKDAKGKQVLREVIPRLRAQPQGVFLDYYAPNPRTQRQEAKISFFQLVPELDAMIGTGGFMDHVLRSPFRQLSWGIGSAAILLALLAIPVLLVLRSMALQNRRLAQQVEERLRTESSLRLSEARFQTFFDESPFMMVVNDLDRGTFIDVNRRYSEFAGASKETLKARTMEEIERLTPKETVGRMLDKIRDEGGFDGEEIPLLKADGSLRTALVSCRVLQVAGSRYTLTVLQDITDQRQAEHEIVRLKNYLSNIIDSMPATLVGLDRTGAVTQWNRQAERMTGLAAEDALGRDLELLLPDFSAWIGPLREEVARARHGASREKLLIEKDGERAFYDVMLYPLVANGVEGAVLRIDDVTERARIQELMVQTEKMLSVGGLAAGMAHEINNPLGIISQASQNLERRLSPDFAPNLAVAGAVGLDLEALRVYFERREIPVFLANIRNAVGRASRIVGNMLQFSRKSDAALVPAPLAGVLEQALEFAANDYDLKKKFDFKNIEVRREFEPGLPNVPMVVIEVQQVLLNLLKNAAQAMGANPSERPPRLTLRLRQEGDWAVLEVEDNGPGMDEAVRRRIFEPFFTTKEPSLGTGLGLSVSYMIITQNHRGTLEVAATPGRGACFTLRLPLGERDGHG